VASYPPGSVEIACAIEAAKRDADYRRRFPRAVLIAWGNGSNPGDVALRRSFRHEARHDRLRAMNATRSRAAGGTGALLPEVATQERGRIMETITQLVLGEGVSDARATQLVEAWTSQPNWDAGLQPLLADEERVARATRLITSLGITAPDPSAMPSLLSIVSHAASVSWEQVTKRTPRQDLDAARDLMLLIQPEAAPLDRAMAAPWLLALHFDHGAHGH
jgi:hypothetical protein